MLACLSPFIFVMRWLPIGPEAAVIRGKLSPGVASANALAGRRRGAQASILVITCLMRV